MLPTEDYKTDSGRKLMLLHRFSPAIGYFLREKVGVNIIEFLPKYGICACFGRNSTNGNIKDMREIVIEDPCSLGLKISKNKNIFLNFADF